METSTVTGSLSRSPPRLPTGDLALFNGYGGFGLEGREYVVAPPAEIGHHVGAALVGTFMGILMCYGMLGPIAQSIELQASANGKYIQCIKDGVLAAARGAAPAIAVEFSRRAIFNDERPSFQELDQAIQWQLVYFRAGARKNEQMQPIAEQLSNEDIRNLGAYFASLPLPKPAEDNNPDLSKKGAQAAAGRRCAACHLDTYAGSKAAARLAGQREDYLVKALRDYKAGVRAGGGQAAMADVAFALSEEEIEALAHFLAYLK